MKKLLTFFILLLIFTSACTATPKKSTLPKLALENEIPIVVIHGSGGNEDSFDAFIQKLNDLPDPSTETLKVTIDGDGQLDYQGTLTKDAKHPIVSIGFEENNAPIEDWSKGLQKLLTHLKKTYQFQQFDAISFSNGGLALTDYAEEYDQKEDVPHLRKMVVLGAPFNELDPEDNQVNLDFKEVPFQTDELKSYIRNRSKLNPQLAVLSIAGDDGSGEKTDSIVPLGSALSSRLIFPENVHTYLEKITTDTHIGLVYNQEVVGWVHHFLTDNPPLNTEKKVELVGN